MSTWLTETRHAVCIQPAVPILVTEGFALSAYYGHHNHAGCMQPQRQSNPAWLGLHWWQSRDSGSSFWQQPAVTCAPADAGDRKAQKVTRDTPTVATKEQPSQAKLPSFQAFEVSTGKTVRCLPPERLSCAISLSGAGFPIVSLPVALPVHHM